MTYWIALSALLFQSCFGIIGLGKRPGYYSKIDYETNDSLKVQYSVHISGKAVLIPLPIFGVYWETRRPVINFFFSSASEKLGVIDSLKYSIRTANDSLIEKRLLSDRFHFRKYKNADHQTWYNAVARTRTYIPLDKRNEKLKVGIELFFGKSPVFPDSMRFDLQMKRYESKWITFETIGL